MRPLVIFVGLEFHDQSGSRVTLGLLFYFRGQGQQKSNNKNGEKNGDQSSNQNSGH